MKVPQYTMFSKSAGVEISAYTKQQEGKAQEGRILLRFFKLEAKGTQIRFIAEPWESFDLFRKIDKVFKDGGKETLTHKFEGKEGEIITKLTVEKFERNDKAGYALVIQRGTESVNVSTDEGHFIYAGEFLRNLSFTQAWTDQIKLKPGS